MLTRLALYMVLGLVLTSQDWQWNSWQFWSVVGLFWASEHLTRIETREQTVAEMTALAARLRQFIEEYQRIKSEEEASREQPK